MRLTRRGLQISLGILWILDGALQLQPAMFTGQFASKVIGAAGSGQPGAVHFVSALSARVIGSQPVLFDALFAAVQLALGFALLSRRTARVALGASIAWAIGVWALGEGFGGLFGPGGTALSGAPGAALLYGALALAAWPVCGAEDARRPAHWLPIAWAGIWAGFAALELLPGRGTASSIASSLTSNLSGLPAGITSAAQSLARVAIHSGGSATALLVGGFALISLLACRPGPARLVAASLGAAVALVIWIFAEGFGGIASGLGTDPNTGPLLVLFALALFSVDPVRRGDEVAASIPIRDATAWTSTTSIAA